MISYEDLAATVSALPAAADPNRRDVHWVTAAEVVGISRTATGRIELFLAGSELNPSASVLRDALDHSSWWRDRDGDPAFQANRLLLPEAEHHSRVAAFLCVELLRNGADEDLPAAFTRTEPLLELVLERLRLSDQSLLGLVGEMLLLAAAVEDTADPDAAAAVAAGWNGWRPSLRDFAWGATGVEVKTTTGPVSTHTVAGTHQVEPAAAQGEQALMLVSIGVQPTAPHANTVTLPGLVDRILGRLGADTDAAQTFLVHLREYGAASGFGYDHRSMREDPAFGADFEVTFTRGYDMADPNVAVLRSEDLARYPHMDPRSLRFTVQLPTTVTGDLNPVRGMHQCAAAAISGRSPLP